MTTAVAERQDKAPANVEPHPASDSGSLLQIISRAASDPSVDIDKMERLLQMHERLVARDAEKDFNASMTEAQIEMGRIKANKDNKQTKSRYADYAQLDKALRPIYTKHNFALSFDTMDGAAASMVRVVAHVSHRDGFTRDYHVDMPTDGKGPQGGDVMTKTHATGAAMTYGMRYLLKMIFNVAIGDDDTDGNMPGDPKPQLVKESRSVEKEMRTEVDACATVEELERLWRSKPFQTEYAKLHKTYQDGILELFGERKADLIARPADIPAGYVPPNFDEVPA